MKIGLISDVHGNILALEKVFEKFDEIGVDAVLCAGDIIGLGPFPEEVVQFLKNKENIYQVRGNHEGYLLDGIPKIIHGRPMNDTETNHHKWQHSRLSEDSINFLKTLPKVQNLEFNGKKIYMTHYPISKFGIYKNFIREPTLEESQKLLEEVDADICIYGHTHIFSKNIDNKKMYINLGATGCPADNIFANAGIINISGGNVEYSPIKIEYDVQSVIEEIRKLKYPFYESVIHIFYGEKE